MTKLDREAMAACIDAVNAGDDAASIKQVADKLAEAGFEDAGRFAASCAQSKSLRLKPWQEPPCAADEDDPNERDKAAQKLLREMLAAGVSRYHPDPLAAIEAAKAGAPA